jgi:hypothetical protein
LFIVAISTHLLITIKLNKTILGQTGPNWAEFKHEFILFLEYLYLIGAKLSNKVNDLAKYKEKHYLNIIHWISCPLTFKVTELNDSCLEFIVHTSNVP